MTPQASNSTEKTSMLNCYPGWPEVYWLSDNSYKCACGVLSELGSANNIAAPRYQNLFGACRKSLSMRISQGGLPPAQHFGIEGALPTPSASIRSHRRFCHPAEAAVAEGLSDLPAVTAPSTLCTSPTPGQPSTWAQALPRSIEDRLAALESENALLRRSLEAIGAPLGPESSGPPAPPMVWVSVIACCAALLFALVACFRHG